jgi:RNA polymerase sigma-70 factor (ECF subfamily)
LDDLVETLYREHASRLAVALALLTDDRHAAEDLVHEVFVRAVDRRAQLAAHPNPIGWLYLTGHNLARNRWRLLARRRHAVAQTHPLLPEREWADLLDLRESLQRLKPPHREAIILHHYLGYGVQEIAGLLGCAPGTVKSRLHRGRDALSQLLENEEATR